MLNVDNFIHHLWHHLVFRALSEMQDTESIEELKTTGVFKDTKRAKKTTGVFQDIHESKDYKQLL